MKIFPIDKAKELAEGGKFADDIYEAIKKAAEEGHNSIRFDNIGRITSPMGRLLECYGQSGYEVKVDFWRDETEQLGSWRKTIGVVKHSIVISW